MTTGDIKPLLQLQRGLTDVTQALLKGLRNGRLSTLWADVNPEVLIDLANS